MTDMPVTVHDYVTLYTADPTAASRQLFAWLCDDEKRAALYCDMNRQHVALPFESRALLDADAGCSGEDLPKSYRQEAFLLADKDHVERAYTQSASVHDPAGVEFSNTPFQGLGGTFMLAIDEPSPGGTAFKSHDQQRAYCYDLLNQLGRHYDGVASVAFRMGALLPLKSRHFDLADLAEQVAIRYVAFLFGFSQADLPLLALTGQSIGKGLQYQMMARHFVDDPFVVPQTKIALGTVSRRAAELIDLYQRPIGRSQQDSHKDLIEEFDKLRGYWLHAPGGTHAHKELALADFKPMMQIMAEDPPPRGLQFSTTEKAILVAGLVGGAVTNIRDAICIAVRQCMELSGPELESVHKAAAAAYLKAPDADWKADESEDFRRYVEEALRVNPPAAFIPRRANGDLKLPVAGRASGFCIPKDSQIVIGVGGGAWRSDTQQVHPAAECPSRFRPPASAHKPGTACPFSKVFGGPPDVPEPARQPGQRAAYTHSCIGMDMAMHVVSHAVRQVILLPGLAQSLDGRNGMPFGLTKTWGYYCESYPLEYQRELLLRQSPLMTVLPIKSPVPENAERLKQVLRFGAPFIEKVLSDARHVHFANFLFLDNDSKLVLFTAYDGDFDAYIGHFAREFGPLFDRFFACIEGGPPSPIAEHPFEFVQFLRRYQHQPVGGYFFSAYPETRVDQIRYQFSNQRNYDWFELGP